MKHVVSWLILCWSIFVVAVYYCGYTPWASIGLLTSNLSAVFALVLIISLSISALRWYRARGAALERPTAQSKARSAVKK